MSLFSKHVELGSPVYLNSWRKVAIGTWATAKDPSVYGVLELDARKVLIYIDQLRQKTGLKITLTHIVGRAIAETLARHPEINCILKFGRVYPRKSVDIFFQVTNDDGKDVSGMTIRQANTKSVETIAREMQAKVDSIRQKGDPEFQKMKGLFGILPGFLSSWILNFSSLLMYTLNIWSPLLGSPRDPFGSVMLTNIGSLGLDFAFAPLVPYSKVPMVLALGALRDVPIVEGDRIIPAAMVSLCATFDHRLIDGAHASKMCKTMQKIFADPEKELGL